ncbi:unnamed protein product [Discula destructiva]
MSANGTGTALLGPNDDGDRYELRSPTALPKAGGFLWNQKMMIHLTCRGYATAQFMHPEPAKYAHAPNIEAKTFMQPEHPYYTHHPGRFVYVKDTETGELFSAPHEPVRAKPEIFVFSVGKSNVSWTVAGLGGIRVDMRLALPTHDVAELWTVEVTNTSSRQRSVDVYPYFTIGYMSWMNQGAEYRSDLGGIVGSSITPYQKAEDYPKIKELKDKTYFLCSVPPDAWEARQEAFEGEGGLHAPSAVTDAAELKGGDARYETPVAAVQYRLSLAPGESQTYRFLFGPALDDDEIKSMKRKYLSEEGFSRAASDYDAYIQGGKGVLQMQTPDVHLDDFVNNWLPRQVFYHGDVNRLTTDPQTRNYLQDNMGMAYINPPVARKAIVTALSQQEKSGAMPDGILLSPDAELKYINQVPHTDHCVWLPIALDVYLGETGDLALLQESITDAHGASLTVFDRLCRAMDWLLSPNARDARGLSYIAQGDWCDPMNMVGYKGKGVSGWLTVATGYALRLWAGVCAQTGHGRLADHYRDGAAAVNAAANTHLWDDDEDDDGGGGGWFARGITDDGVTFGVQKDREGRIWLNPQAWAILGGAASADDDAPGKVAGMLRNVDELLGTPYGTLMFWPPFSGMREDVGRVTQKFPGQGENGSVYNHAAAFYVHALYSIGEADRAYRTLRQMLPGPGEEDYVRRGQLPVYIPNYYRGGWKEFPERAGRSSQLFNTGTVSWVYRSFIEGLCGLRGDALGLRIEPQLPTQWDGIKVQRTFRGAHFDVDIRRGEVEKGEVVVVVDGKTLTEPHVTGIEAGKVYRVAVTVSTK